MSAQLSNPVNPVVFFDVTIGGQVSRENKVGRTILYFTAKANIGAQSSNFSTDLCIVQSTNQKFLLACL